MFPVRGSCHCGNILMDMELARAPDTYQPRACNCDFCRQHNAAYVSDPQGSLAIWIKDQNLSGKYSQGSGQAAFLFCKHCGVLVGVYYSHEGRVYAAVNARAVQGGKPFGPEQSASPQTLSASDKVQRWQALWFSSVNIVCC
ncbi:MAG: aldehyde-activating protein [Gammaproteobacteria bacterium]|nr:aldehyde-activating protein [Gammaproteobacteria bacterium]